MGALITEILEDTFVKKSSSSYNLSILVGADRFSILVSDDRQQLHALRSYNTPNSEDLGEFKAALHDTYLTDNLLKLSYQSVMVMVLNDRSTLVPQQLYKEENRTIFLEKIIKLSAADEVLADPLRILDTWNVFTLDTGVKTIFQSYYPQALFVHATTPFILGTHKLSTHRSGHHLYVNVHDKRLHIVLFEDQNLWFSNIFPYQDSRDFLYHIMLIYDQFKLKPESIPLHLAGHLIEDSEVYKLLYRYIRHIHFIQSPEYFRFGERFRSLPVHQYFDILSLKLCE